MMASVIETRPYNIFLVHFTHGISWHDWQNVNLFWDLVWCKARCQPRPHIKQRFFRVLGPRPGWHKNSRNDFPASTDFVRDTDYGNIRDPRTRQQFSLNFQC
jgi:hypothetical protein